MTGTTEQQQNAKRTDVKCPECGGTNIDALVRGTAYATHTVRGLENGRLVLAPKPTEEWIENYDEMDEELRCRDCAAFPYIEDYGLQQDQYVLDSESATEPSVRTA